MPGGKAHGRLAPATESAYPGAMLSRKRVLVLGLVVGAAGLISLVWPNSPWQAMKQASEAHARREIIKLTAAVEHYRARTGGFPKQLEDLATSEPPFVKFTDLLDPWDSRMRLYRYDPAGPQNGGRTSGP